MLDVSSTSEKLFVEGLYLKRKPPCQGLKLVYVVDDYLWMQAYNLCSDADDFVELQQLRYKVHGKPSKLVLSIEDVVLVTSEEQLVLNFNFSQIQKLDLNGTVESHDLALVRSIHTSKAN